MNALNWFEIPCADLARAQAFYETLLGTALRRETVMDQALAILPYEPATGVGGALVLGDGYTPGDAGAVVYLPATPSLDAALARLPASGRVLTPKVTLPGEMGVYAHVLDSEGNRVGLHAAH